MEFKRIDSVSYNSLVPSAIEPELIYRAFGRRLRELRKKKDLPQEELATLSGLTRASIANIESGRQRVHLHQLLKFADALGIDLGTLVSRMSDYAKAEDTGLQSSMHDYLKRVQGVAVGARAKERRSR